MVAPAYELDPVRAQARADRFEGYGDGGFGLDLAAPQNWGRFALSCSPPDGLGWPARFPARPKRRCDLRPPAGGPGGGDERDPPHQGHRRTRADRPGVRTLACGAIGGPGRRGPGRARDRPLHRSYARAQTEAGAPIQFAGDLLAGDRSGLVTGPVATPGRRRVQRNDVVVSDMVVCHDGYCGDTADTFFAGRHEEAERAYEFMWGVLERAAAAMLRGFRRRRSLTHPRRRSSSAIRTALFPHHGGHGLGVTGFEDPHLIPARPDPLQEGMVIAIEPGVYFPVASASGWSTTTS